MSARRPLLWLVLAMALLNAVAGLWHHHDHDAWPGAASASWQGVSDAPASGLAPPAGVQLGESDPDDDAELHCRCAWCASHFHQALIAASTALRPAAAPSRQLAHQALAGTRVVRRPPHWTEPPRGPPPSA